MCTLAAKRRHLLAFITCLLASFALASTIVLPAFADDEEPLVLEPTRLVSDDSLANAANTPFATTGTSAEAEVSADEMAVQGENNWVPFPFEVQIHQNLARELFDYTNTLRASQKVGKLVWDADLEETALQRATEALFLMKDDHSRPNGTSWTTAYPAFETEVLIGENLAKNANYDEPARAAYDGLYASPGHYKNMVNTEFVSVGMACVATYDDYYENWMYAFAQCFSGAKGSGSSHSQASGSRVFAVPVYDDLASSMSVDPPTMLMGIYSVERMPKIALSFSGGKSKYGYDYDITGTAEFAYPDINWTIANTKLAELTSNANFVRGLALGQTTCTASFAHSSRWSKTIGLTVTKWVRAWGDNAFGTMEEISQFGWKDNSCDTVVLATFDGYWDALTASGLASQYDSPLLLSSKDTLAEKAQSEIKRLGAKHVIVVGGTASISDKTFNQIKSLGVTVERVSGNNAAETALAIYRAGLKGTYGWSDTAVIATSSGYWDALAGAPFSYATCAPVLLANEADTVNGGTKLSVNTIDAIKKGGFKRIVICGGTSSVSVTVEKQLSNAGFKGSVVRLAGKTACETSSKIAEFCLVQGMKASGIGVASRDGYWDALTGAALCGSFKAPLVLVADDNRSAITDFIAKNASDIEVGIVFGGYGSVSNSTYQTLVARG